MDSDKRLLTIEQFCKRYNVGRTAAYEELKTRRLKAVKVGRKTLIPQDGSEEWLQGLPEARPSAA